MQIETNFNFKKEVCIFKSKNNLLSQNCMPQVDITIISSSNE